MPFLHGVALGIEFSNIHRVTFNIILRSLVAPNLLPKLPWETGSICNPLISAATQRWWNQTSLWPLGQINDPGLTKEQQPVQLLKRGWGDKVLEKQMPLEDHQKARGTLQGERCATCLISGLCKLVWCGYINLNGALSIPFGADNDLSDI